MLYEVLTFVLAMYAMSTPLIYKAGVKFGLKCAEKPEEACEEPVFALPKRKERVEMPKEFKNGLDILANIDAYDGTSAGQKEIK
jgi:GTP cyclohydrolase III